jgi:nanoRNase/pAp phosphatase (c-di-AMP/oligoRNAs hydrolase)
MISFDEAIRAQKAAEWLLQNDALIVALHQNMKASPAQAIVFAAYYGEEIRRRVRNVAENMTVTDDERKFGYSAPTTEEAKREKRAEIDRVIAMTTNPISGK